MAMHRAFGRPRGSTGWLQEGRHLLILLFIAEGDPAISQPVLQSPTMLRHSIDADVQLGFGKFELQDGHEIFEGAVKENNVGIEVVQDFGVGLHRVTGVHRQPCHIRQIYSQMQQGHPVVVGAVDRHMGAGASLLGSRQRVRHRMNGFLRLSEIDACGAVDEGQVLWILRRRAVEIVGKSHL